MAVLPTKLVNAWVQIILWHNFHTQSSAKQQRYTCTNIRALTENVAPISPQSPVNLITLITVGFLQKKLLQLAGKVFHFKLMSSETRAHLLLSLSPFTIADPLSKTTKRKRIGGIRTKGKKQRGGKFL